MLFEISVQSVAQSDKKHVQQCKCLLIQISIYRVLKVRNQV